MYLQLFLSTDKFTNGRYRHLAYDSFALKMSEPSPNDKNNEEAEKSSPPTLFGFDLTDRVNIFLILSIVVSVFRDFIPHGK